MTDIQDVESTSIAFGINLYW